MLLAFLFGGCKKDELPDEQIQKFTFESAQELNEKSDFWEHGILDPLPYPMVIPGGGAMNDDIDRFDCFSYAGENYITRIFLLVKNEIDILTNVN